MPRRPLASPRERGRRRSPVAGSRVIAFVAAVAVAAFATARAEGTGSTSSSTPTQRVASADASTTRLRADFVTEDVARAVDVIAYEGPAYAGCCPNVDGEHLACCAAGGCCPNTEPGGGYGKHLACCESKGGSEAHNRAASRVWYSGPSYDGCCPNADGENLACCGESKGCCPADGSARLGCCPRLATEGEAEETVEDDVSVEDAYDADDLEEKRQARAERVWRRERNWDGASGASSYGEKAADERNGEEGVESTMYLQLAAGLCVVVWAVALAAGTFYSRSDGRGEDEEDARLVPADRRRRRAYAGF